MFKIFITLLIFAGSCKQKANETVFDSRSGARDGENRAIRITSYNADDIKKVEVFPFKSFTGVPWEKSQILLVGTFPDDSKATIHEAVKFSLSSNDGFRVLEETGEVLALKEGEVTITGKFREMSASKLLKFKFGKVSAKLPEAAGYKLDDKGPTYLELSWSDLIPEEYSFYLVYQEGSSAPENCESGTRVSPEKISEDNKVKVEGLKEDTIYRFRLCTSLEIKFGEESFTRVSDGRVLVAQTAKANN